MRLKQIYIIIFCKALIFLRFHQDHLIFKQRFYLVSKFYWLNEAKALALSHFLLTEFKNIFIKTSSSIRKDSS